MTSTKTIGIERVACWIAASAGEPLAMMRFGPCATSSAAKPGMRLTSPLAQRHSIARL